MMESRSSSAKTQQKSLFVVVVIVLAISLVSTSIIAGLFYHGYESILESEPHYSYPHNYIQTINTSLFRGPLGYETISGITVNLSWPAHISGKISYDAPVYFFILWTSHSYPSRFSSQVSYDKNWSIYFLGPLENATISLSLPPGTYVFCIASTFQGNTTGTANIYADYSYFTP